MSKTLETSGADPLLSANIYCAEHLDHVMAEVVRPIWSALAEARRADQAWLWVMRYGKRGEHLKLRIHAPEPSLAALRTEVEQRTRDLFAHLPEPQEEDQDSSAVQLFVPPIDVEDRIEEAHSDRALLITEYQRHRLSLGAADFLGDDRYCLLMTRALAAATGLLLASADGESGAEQIAASRLTMVFTGVAAALDSLGFSPQKRASYAAYHRDWLLRFSLKRTSPKIDPADGARRRFDQKLAAIPAAQRQALLAKTVAATAEPSAEMAEWTAAVRALHDYAGPLVRAMPHALDPHAEDHFDSVLFKLLQCFANASGLRVFDEAYVHHMLHAAVRGGEKMTLPAV